MNDDKSGQQFQCRDCGTLVRVPEANDDDSDGASMATNNSPPSQPFIPVFHLLAFAAKCFVTSPGRRPSPMVGQVIETHFPLR